MVNKRDAQRALKRAAAEKYGRDVQAALLVYRMNLDPSDANQIASEFFEPSPKEQPREQEKVWLYLNSGFEAHEIAAWWRAGVHADGHWWHKAGYTPVQARWAEVQIRSLFPQDNVDAGPDDPSTHEQRISFIRDLTAKDYPVEDVVLALRAGAASPGELMKWLDDARENPGSLKNLGVLAALGGNPGPRPDNDE